MSFWQNVFLTKRLLTNVVCQHKQNFVLRKSHLPWKRSARIFCAKKTWTQPNASWEDFASAHKVWHLGTAAHPFTLSLALLISTTCIQNIFPWSSFLGDKRTFLNLIWPFGQSISMLDYHVASTGCFRITVKRKRRRPRSLRRQLPCRPWPHRPRSEIKYQQKNDRYPWSISTPDMS